MRRLALLTLGISVVTLLVVAACGGSAPETVEFNLDIRERELDTGIDGVPGEERGHRRNAHNIG